MAKEGESDENVLKRALPDPTWYSLSRLGEEGMQGSLLLLAQVFFKADADTVVPMSPRSIRPTMDEGQW